MRTGIYNSKKTMILKEGLQEFFHEYYEDGTPKYKGQYLKNERVGVWKTFREDGGILEINEYSGDEFGGLQKVYHKNGQLGVLGKALDGHEVGAWIYLDTDGDTLKVEEYNSEGALTNTKIYKEHRNVE